MVSALSQVFTFALFILAALALTVQGHRNGDNFGGQVQAGAQSGLPTHIQDIIQRRSLLHKGGKGGGDGGYGGYGGKSWFKGEKGARRRHQ